MKKFANIFILFFIGLLSGLFIYYAFLPPFNGLSIDEMHQKIIEQRDLAIKKAINEGIYNCCVEPPCTMCFMEANQWNNQEAGRCNCADFIRQGKEPCPQCKKILAQGGNNQ